MNNKIFDILIIGSGPSGLFAAFEACSSGLSVCLVETLDFIGGQCSVLYPEKFIYDLPGHIKITAIDFINNLMGQLDRFKNLIEFNPSSEILQIHKNEDNIFESSSKNQIFFSKTILISSGCGSFIPNKPLVENLEEFENLGLVHFLVNNKALYQDKIIAIAGGGDSAVDWAINLSNVASKIYFIHRRQNMKCAESSLNELYDIAKTNKIEFYIPYISHKISRSSERLMKMELKNFDDEMLIKEIHIDYFLPFFGLKADISNIKKWGLDISSKHKIKVDNHMSTNLNGVFGSGDIIEYEGKTKLLVSCFHESSVAINSVLDYLQKNHNYKKTTFAYSTSKF